MPNALRKQKSGQIANIYNNKTKKKQHLTTDIDTSDITPTEGQGQISNDRRHFSLTPDSSYNDKLFNFAHNNDRKSIPQDFSNIKNARNRKRLSFQANRSESINESQSPTREENRNLKNKKNINNIAISETSESNMLCKVQVIDSSTENMPRFEINNKPLYLETTT